jgi:hypothetical protein
MGGPYDNAIAMGKAILLGAWAFSRCELQAGSTSRAAWGLIHAGTHTLINAGHISAFSAEGETGL